MLSDLRNRHRFIVGGASALGAAATIKARAKAAQFEFKCGTTDAASDSRSLRLGQMWATIERESGGRIRTEFYPNSILGGEDALFGQLRLGALHFQSISPGVLAGVIPAWNVPYLGFAFKDANEGFRAMTGPLGDYCHAETQNKGLYAFRSIWQTGMGHICSTTHPIRTPDDLRGFRVRLSNNKISVDFFKILGASPTTLTLPEVYPALQTKLVDGLAAANAVVESSKWYEVLKYISLTTQAWYANWTVANGDVWKSLPPDLQAIVERNVVRYSKLATQDRFDSEAAVQRKLVEQGITFNQVDQAPFRARLGAYYKEWSTEFGPTAWTMLQNSLSHKLM